MELKLIIHSEFAFPFLFLSYSFLIHPTSLTYKYTQFLLTFIHFSGYFNFHPPCSHLNCYIHWPLFFIQFNQFDTIDNFLFPEILSSSYAEGAFLGSLFPLISLP